MSCSRSLKAIVLCFATVLTQSLAMALDLADIIRLNESATLVITGQRENTGAQVQGSGFCVDTRGLVLTTAHQATGVAGLQGRLATGEVVGLSVLAVDPSRETALLRADRPLPNAVILGDAELLTRGDPLVCIASPGNLEFTVSRGIVSGRPRQYRGMAVIQTDIPASPGSSGGPVFDRFGNVVGFIILYLEDEQWVVFANPINNAFPILRAHGVRLPDTAIASDEEAVLVPEQDITERERRAIEAYNRGVHAETAEAKVNAFRLAVQLLPRFYEAQFNLGVACQALGDANAALEAYREAALLRPEDARVYRNLGRVYLGMGRYDDGAQAFEKARDLAPDSAQSCNDLGVAYQHLGRGTEAEGLFRSAVLLDPDHAGAHYNLAVTLADSGRDREAVKHFETYLSLRPEAADADEVRAWVTRLGVE